jgi:hypothetical protein
MRGRGEMEREGGRKEKVEGRKRGKARKGGGGER